MESRAPGSAARAASSSARRVLFVNENIGGHRSMHLGISRFLQTDHRVDADFLDVPPPGTLRRAFAAPLPWFAERDLDLQPLRYQLAQSAWVAGRLRRIAPRYDCLHLYTQNVALLSAGTLRRGPSVVSIDATGTQNAYLLPYREATEHTAARVTISRRFEDRVYEAATLVVPKSEWARRSLVDEYGLPADRVRCIPFGLALPARLPHREANGLPEITFVGTTLERKGGRRLLRAFHNHLTGKATVNVVTRDPLPPRPGVRVFDDLVPGDPRLQEILARTAVFAFPTEIDTFGYAILEAMAAGVPVVTTPINAIPELVVDGETGILVEPDDDALARALLRLIDDEPLRRRMGEAARRRVSERFDAHRTTARLAEVVDEAVERYGARSAGSRAA